MGHLGLLDQPIDIRPAVRFSIPEYHESHLSSAILPPHRYPCLYIPLPHADNTGILLCPLRALTLSEFSAPRWQVPGPGAPGETLGQAILRANDLDNPPWWIGAAIGILVGYVVLANVVLNVALRLLNGAAPRMALRARMHVLDRICSLLCLLVCARSLRSPGNILGLSWQHAG